MDFKGRIEKSQLSFDEKHPVILPNCHVSLLLVRFHHVLLKHAGVGMLVVSVRNHYWVIGLRRLAKQVDALACEQTIVLSPEVRVCETPPFSITGSDHTGGC